MHILLNSNRYAQYFIFLILQLKELPRYAQKNNK